MEEHQPQIPPHHPAYRTSRSRAQQSYSVDDVDDLPMEEEANVVPMPVKPRSPEMIAEDALNPRSTAKRKQAGAAQGKPRSPAAKKTKSFRQYQGSAPHAFAEELQRLEAQAERINQILADRTRRQTWSQQTPESSQAIPGLPNQPVQHQSFQSSQRIQPSQPPERTAPPPLEDEDTENLKVQAKRIIQRLAELETMMEEAESLAEPADASIAHDHPGGRAPGSQRSVPVNSPPWTHAPVQPPSPQSQSWNINTDARQRAEQDAWRTAEELRHLISQERTGYPTSDMSQARGMPSTENRTRTQPFEPAMRQSLSAPRRSRWWRFLELPRKRVDRIGDAILWIVVSAMVRVGSRYVLASFPFLSPVLLFLMLTPAMLAVFLAIFVPRAGWVPIYRLLLIMLGLLIGGKL